ncbi:Gamma-tubulin complex component 4 [Mortierella claussenii]|nr:Gamma-tubulin complex component 4 [Mortierella claussenii]
MLHELLVTLSGYPGDIFRPFPPEPALPTTFAITDFPLLHPAEKESLDRLAQLGFYFQRFNQFIASCHAPVSLSTTSQDHIHKKPQGLYLKALANVLERRLDTYRQVIIQTEAAILSGQDNLGGMVPLSTISVRFAPFQLVFPAINSLLADIEDGYLTETPYVGGRLIDLIQDRAASGVPIQREWMNELLQGCCAVMMRQIVSWIIYGQIQDPFDEFFIVQHHLTTAAAAEGPGVGSSSGGFRSDRLHRATRISSSSLSRTSSTSTAGSKSIKWQAEYVLDENMIPTMIPTTLAQAMLFTGKAIATARQAKPTPIPIPHSMTQQHLQLIMPFMAFNTTASTDSIKSEVLNINQFVSVVHQIRRDIASHLWVVVQVGDKVVRTLESFRRYFLLCDGEFGLGLIEALEDFKRNRLSRLAHFVTSTATTVSIRDHDLGGILSKAAQNTSAQDDPALSSFEFRLVKPQKSAQIDPQAVDGANEKDQNRDHSVTGMFDDQHLGIPVRLWFTLAWPLDFFLTAEDLSHYGDVFAFLLTVRKTQVKLQQTWIEIKSMTQHMTGRSRGRGARSYEQRIRGHDRGTVQSHQQEIEILRHIATIRSDMTFVVDCLWTYLQMDVIGPTYDGLLHSIIQHETEQKHSALSTRPTSPTTSSPSSKTFDSIHSLHAEALYEIRRACLLTSETLSLTVKEILLGVEQFCGIIGRRAAGQDGFQAGLGQDQDESMWQDWRDICRLNQEFRTNMSQLFSNLSAVSRSGSLGDGPVLRRSVSGLGSSLLGNGATSFNMIRQLDQLLLRLEYSKRMWFSVNNSSAMDDEGGRDASPDEGL